MYLRTQVIGRLGHAPKKVTTQGGTQFVVLSVAASIYRGKERGNETTWIDVSVWNEIKCKYLLDYAKKGQLVFVEGEPSARAYESRGGEPRASLQVTVGRFEGEVKILSGKDEGEAGGDDEAERKPRLSRQTPADDDPPFDPDVGDEIDELPGWN